MNLIDPIRAILLYLAIQLAPPEANHITIEGPQIERTVLIRESGVWTHQGLEVIAADEKLLSPGASGEESPISLDGYLPDMAEHDWSKEPSIAMRGGILTKVASGFSYEGNGETGAEKGVCMIRYSGESRSAIFSEVEITVNLLGEIKSPGVYKIPANGTLIDALAAAGGWTPQANLKKVLVLRGPAGEKANVTSHDFASMMGGEPAPLLKDRDTVYVTERWF